MRLLATLIIILAASCGRDKQPSEPVRCGLGTVGACGSVATPTPTVTPKPSKHKNKHLSQ
jgi:hypothetical protein